MEKSQKTVVKLGNGDRVGAKVAKDKAVLVAEVMRVTEAGDSNGFSLSLTLDEARFLQAKLAGAIAEIEAMETPEEN